MLSFTYREDAAAVVGLMQLGRRTAGLSGASFGPVRVAHWEDGEGEQLIGIFMAKLSVLRRLQRFLRKCKRQQRSEATPPTATDNNALSNLAKVGLWAAALM